MFSHQGSQFRWNAVICATVTTVAHDAIDALDARSGEGFAKLASNRLNRIQTFRSVTADKWAA